MQRHAREEDGDERGAFRAGETQRGVERRLGQPARREREEDAPGRRQSPIGCSVSGRACNSRRNSTSVRRALGLIGPRRRGRPCGRGTGRAPGTLPATTTPVATAHAQRTTTVAGDGETMAMTNSKTHATPVSTAIAPRTAAWRRVPRAVTG